jgi:acyl-CoA synthetase (AMP-forming)/AMP-acid ligase II
MNIITQVLEHNAKSYGNEVALVEINPEQKARKRKTWKEYELVDGGSEREYHRSEITWHVFNEKSNRVANMLLDHGIGKGNKVGILLMNCLEWLPIYFGILKTGAIAVPLNFRYSSDEIKYCLELAEVDVLFFGIEFIGRVEEIAEDISEKVMPIFYGAVTAPSFAEDYSELVSNCSSASPEILLTPQDHAAIYFSSGTTGFPKAILHNHRALMYACEVEQAHHGQTHDDIFLCIPPLYHTGAKMHWFGSFLVGGKGIILKGIAPEYIMRTVHEEKCTIVWLLVPWAQDILTALDSGELKLSDYDLKGWRLMHIGAQPVPQSLVKRWLEYFPHQQYDTNYGLSESIGPGCVHLGVENTHKVGAIGVAGHGWACKITDENGITVKQGEVGELCVKGDGVMLCYYRDEEATKQCLLPENGGSYLRTGDMAMQDEDGFIFLVDRKKDVIITGGENIYPVQIENFLAAHTAIQDVAVIGLPDERLGEITCAIIQVKKNHECSEDDINTFCHSLPRYKRPKKIIFADVPRNATGKIEKPKLRKIYGADNFITKQQGTA